MTSESKTWQRLKDDYLCQVEKALSSVRHPKARDVLDDVAAHLERRRSELGPDGQTAEDLGAIIADMGPPADYAELLESEGGTCRTEPSRRSLPWGVLIGAVVIGLVAMAVLVVRGVQGPGDKAAAQKLAAQGWSVWQQQKYAEAETLFAEAVEEDPANANAWNGLGWSQFHQGKSAAAVTSFERCLAVTPDHAGALNGLGWIAKKDHRIDEAIGCWERAIEALPSATAALNGLATTYMEMQHYRKAVEVYEKWLMAEPDNARVKADLEKARRLGSTAIYIVTFRPVAPFAPKTSRELLDAFNERHPPNVRTHHYRTQIEEGVLIGSICVDTEAGKDAVVAMLADSSKLVLVEAVRATPEALERLNAMGQPSLSSSARRKTRDRTDAPTTHNRTVQQTGPWPAGDCSILGYVSRAGRFGRPDNAKICLSSEAFGSWVVEVEDHGRVEFQSIPAGTYRLYTTNTAGYRDAYYNPQEQDVARPTFELRKGNRIQPRIRIEPVRPYRKIAGRVLYESGGALADYTGLTVTAWVQRPQGAWKRHYRRLSETRVQADGTYVLDQLDGRPVYVQVRDSRPPVQTHPYPPRFYPGTFSRPQARLVTFGEADGVEEVDIAMADRGGLAIAGLVTDGQSGRPVGQALVTVFHYDMFFDLFYTYTDEQGRYHLEGLGEGKFIVHIDAVHQGYVKTRKIATVAAGAARTQLDFALSPGVDISGTFVDEQGQPYQVGRGFGSASHKGRGFAARASNFPYGNKYAPKHIREGTTVFYEEGEGDATGTMFVFPTETLFLLPAVAPGDVALRFTPRGRGERVTKILHQGRGILDSGLTVEPGRDVNGVTIVIRRPRGS